MLGPAADSIGRRPVFLLAAAIISSAGMASALAPNYSVVRLTIFITGFGVGGLTVPFDILAEFLPSSHRGTNLLLIEYFWTAGCLFVVLAAYLTLSGEKDHWRIFVAICSLPCVASFIFGFLYVPESPRWLCTKGKTCRAMEILRTACLVNGHDPDLVFPPHVALMEEPDEAHASVADLFQPKWRLTTLRLLGTWVGFAFGYYGTVMAVTRVFASYKHNNITQDEEHLYSGHSRFLLSTARITNIGDGDNGFDFDYSAIFFTSVAEFLGTTAVILKVESWGRIPLQVSNVLPNKVLVLPNHMKTARGMPVPRVNRLSSLLTTMQCIRSPSIPLSAGVVVYVGRSVRLFLMFDSFTGRRRTAGTSMVANDFSVCSANF